MEEQNQYDLGWYDGIQYGLTMHDICNDIYPDENQPVLIYINGLFLSAIYRTFSYEQDGEQCYQTAFVTVSGEVFYPGYVRFWMPLPMIPDNNKTALQNY